MHGPEKVQSGAGGLTMGPPQVVCGLGQVGSQGDMGLSSQSHWVNATLELAISREGSIQARWHLSVDFSGGVPNKEAMAPGPLILILASYNSVFMHIFLVPPELLTLCQSPGQVSKSK